MIWKFILEKSKLNHMKGLSPLIAMVLVTAFGFVGMTIVLTVVNPLLDRAKDAGIVNEATQNMQLVDSAVKAVASEARGSKRTLHIKITEGVLRSDFGSDWIYFEYEPRTRTVLDGFAGDVKIESKPVFLEYFNRYGDNSNANNTWTSVNGSWSVSSGRFLGIGGIAYKNIGNESGFDLAASVVVSSAPHGQVYLVPGDPRNLVLFLPFDGNVNTTVTTAYDYSAYKQNGTLRNVTVATCFTSGACPSWVDGRFGNATQFDGIGDYINVSDSSQLDITQEITIAAWLKTYNPSAWDRPIQKFIPSGSVPIYAISNRGLSNGGWGCEFSNVSSGANADTSKVFFDDVQSTNDTWYHVVCVGSKSGDYFRVYINGVQENSKTWFTLGDIDVNAIDLNIGRSRSAEYKGVIDEVMVFNRALSADEVAFLYESSREKITASGEIPTIDEDANVTIVLASPGSNYFDNVKLKSGAPKIRFVVPYQNVDIVNQTRFGPGDHNIVIRHYGTNTTSNRPMIGLEE